MIARKGKEGGGKCRHRNGVGYRWEYDGWRPVTQFVDTRLAKVFWLDRVTCDCGTWLPLGDSKDEPEAVRTEMQMAACIAEVDELWEPRQHEGAIRDIVDEFVEWDARKSATHDSAEEEG